MLTITKLSTNCIQNPLAVPVETPQFSWIPESPRMGARQVSYRITVHCGSHCCWDSGDRISSETCGIPYEGLPLRPGRHYALLLQITDELGETSTASGFFETAPEDFAGAQWIGSDRLTLSAHALSVFRLSYTLQILPGSTSASFLFGGNDLRLQNAAYNMQGVCARQDEARIRLTLDLAPLEKGQCAVFTAERFGYAPEDGQGPLYSAELPASVVNSNNCHAPHTVELASVFGEVEILIDGVCITKSNQPAQGGFPPENSWNLNPVGKGNNYICFPLLCDIGVELAPGQQAVFSDFTVRNYRQPCSPLQSGWPEAICGGGSTITCSGGEAGLLLLADPSHGSMLQLRTAITVRSQVARARLYATARGIYEFTLNGQRVGDDYFAPGLSQYNKTHYYQVYDITEQLHAGSNRLEAQLAEGWWSGNITFEGEKWNYFGDRQSLLCRLTVDYENGDTEHFVSSPDSWEYAEDGPVLLGSLFQGQVQDLRRTPSCWLPAVIVEQCSENSFIGDMPSPFTEALHQDFSELRLAPQPDRGVKEVARLSARSVTEPRPGIYIYDIGQNHAGIPSITLTGKAGDRIVVRYAEVLYPDMPEYSGMQGMLMLENIRAALAQDVFFLKDGLQTLCPHFTFHGYRYIEISGIDAQLPLDAVESIALSSAELTADFRCSSPEISRLYQNICWSLRSNFLSIPTDCPQRNERLGWSGDLSVFSRTAVYMADCSRFLSRHMQAMRDVQSTAGRFADVAPLGGGFGGVLWGSAGITVPWEVYQQTGDLEIMRSQFPAMLRYIHFLQDTIRPESGIINDGPLGDWLSPEREKNEPAFFWQCYYLYDLKLVLETARLLGREELLPELSAARDAAYAALKAVYFDPENGKTVYSCEEAASGSGMGGPPRMGPPRPLPQKTSSGRYLMDTMSSYAVPIALGILDADTESAAGQLLLETVVRSNTDDNDTVLPPYSLMTGFIGTAWICPALSQTGSDAAAWRMLRNESYPSWLYPVLQGATTIWEQLDSYTHENGFGGMNAMNSFNHYSFGAVGYWLLSHVLGLRRSGPACFYLAPIPDPDLAVDWAEGSIETVRGTFRSGWRRTDSGIHYALTIPAGPETEVLLQAEAGSTVTIDGVACQADSLPGIGTLRTLLLESGSHSITIKA